jgi:type IX secretion system PorP/SprF family membrane protein
MYPMKNLTLVMNTKNRSVKWLAMLIVSLLNISTIKAQDIHFSQLFETPLLRNPSLAGLFEGDVRVQGVFRDQWNSFANAYRTGSLNAEYKMPVGQSDNYYTIAAQMVFDKAGSAGLTTTQVLPAINYHKSLSSEKTSYLSIGFMAGMIQKRIDPSKITTDNQYNGLRVDPNNLPGEDIANVSQTYFDGSAGISFNTEYGNSNTFFIGGAYHHFNRPKSSFYRDAAIEINAKLVGSIGTRMNVGETGYVTLQADHSRQGSFSQTMGGIMYSHKLGETYDGPLYVMHVGTMLRWKDAVVPVIKLDKEQLSFALSYDVNISSLKTASVGRGGVELSVSYRGFLDRPNSTKGVMNCPRF